MAITGSLSEHRRRHLGAVGALPGHQLRGAEVPPEIRGLDLGKDQQSERREPDREADLPQRAASGSQANIARVKVDLPKQLPSRLTTLQKACTAAQFEANPAGCPAASIIGHAKAITPLLPVPLEGPAILRQPRRRSVPQPDRRAAGLRRDASTSSARRSSAKPGSPAARSRPSPTPPSAASN